MHLSRSFRYGLIKITIYLLILVLFIFILRSIRWEFYNDGVTMVFAWKNSDIFMSRLKMFRILIYILRHDDIIFIYYALFYIASYAFHRKFSHLRFFKLPLLIPTWTIEYTFLRFFRRFTTAVRIYLYLSFFSFRSFRLVLEYDRKGRFIFSTIMVGRAGRNFTYSRHGKLLGR